MDDVLDDFVRLGQRCGRAAKSFEQEPLLSIGKLLFDAAESVGDAWSGSWIGYQAHVYKIGLVPRMPGEHFDSEWGAYPAISNQTSGEWGEYSYDAVHEAILDRANGVDPDELEKAARATGKIFDECRRELLATFDAVIATHGDAILKKLRKEATDLASHISRSDFLVARRPTQFMTRDARATQGGIRPPHHLAVQAWTMEQLSYGQQIKKLAEFTEHAVTYLQKRKKMKGTSVAKTDGPVFIGHGRSHVWMHVKDFLTDRLGLEHEEFNRESTAGRSTKERLLEMLDKCCFAFLVMTAEDEQGDGKKHARQNVVHEAGLFQGRYGFERAIVLLEDGCEEFSNINSIGQIRFPKDNVSAAKEEIRRVLEREGIIK